MGLASDGPSLSSAARDFTDRELQRRRQNSLDSARSVKRPGIMPSLTNPRIWPNPCVRPPIPCSPMGAGCRLPNRDGPVFLLQTRQNQLNQNRKLRYSGAEMLECGRVLNILWVGSWSIAAVILVNRPMADLAHSFGSLLPPHFSPGILPWRLATIR